MYEHEDDDAKKLLKKFGKTVKRIRKDGGLSREELAELMNAADEAKVQQKLERFGQNIKNLREQAGLSVDDLAKRSEMSRAKLSQIESGCYRCELSASAKIAQALEVGLAELYKGI